MAWLIRRAALILCFSLGTSLWYLLTHVPPLASSLPRPPAPAAPAAPKDAGPRRSKAQDDDDSLGQTIKFWPASPVSGSINVRTLVLRESASPSAPVVARLKMGENESVEIVEATRDSLRVRVAAGDGTGNEWVAHERDYEGWTTWASIIPSVTAIVLDAETGALVARVPLDYDVDSVTFSPDGSKALFYPSEGGTLAREVRTSDYTLTRTLTSPLAENFSSPFYGADGDVYVAAYKQGNMVDGSKLSLVSIAADEGPNLATGVASEDYEFLAVSPDGSKVFVGRKRQEGDCEMKVDVFDVKAGQLLNTLTLTGVEMPWSANSFVVSGDGTELYAQLSEQPAAIAVIDTRTGHRLREFPAPARGWFHLQQWNLVGKSLLIATWNNELPTAFWVDDRLVTRAARGVYYASEAAGTRYGINEDGTRFFQLDAKGGVKASFPVPRPELLRGGKISAEDLTSYGLAASPDGKRVIIFVGFAHSC